MGSTILSLLVPFQHKKLPKFNFSVCELRKTIAECYCEFFNSFE